MSKWVNYLTTVWTKHIEPTNASPSSYFIPTNRNNASFSCAFRTFSLSLQPYDDYIIQTLDVGTFAPFGEQCTCSAVNKKELECIKETISKYCAKFTRKEAILTPLVHFNKTSITSDCWQILFFSPDHFNNDFY